MYSSCSCDCSIANLCCEGHHSCLCVMSVPALANGQMVPPTSFKVVLYCCDGIQTHAHTHSHTHTNACRCIHTCTHTHADTSTTFSPTLFLTSVTYLPKQANINSACVAITLHTHHRWLLHDSNNTDGLNARCFGFDISENPLNYNGFL